MAGIGILPRLAGGFQLPAGPVTAESTDSGAQVSAGFTLDTANEVNYGRMRTVEETPSESNILTEVGRFAIGLPVLPQLHMLWTVVSSTGSGFFTNLGIAPDTWVSQAAPATSGNRIITAFTNTSGANTYTAAVDFKFSLDGGVTVAHTLRVNFICQRLA